MTITEQAEVFVCKTGFTLVDGEPSSVDSKLRFLARKGECIVRVKDEDGWSILRSSWGEAEVANGTWEGHVEPLCASTS